MTTAKVIDIKCSRGQCENAGDAAPCPFAREIHGDDDECSCCDDCRSDCAMEI